MKRLALPLLLLAMLLPAPRTQAALDRSLFVALSASVLRVEAPRRQGGFALGSAVTVGDEMVVTNCHVTRDALAVEVVRGGVRWAADLQASDVERDLCLLHVPGLVSPPAPLGRAADLAYGQPVMALGYTGGVGIQNSDGEVVELHRFDGGRIIRSSNWFTSGASGGGLFDARGRLVGILTFRLRGGEAHYFAAPVEWVGQMLKDRRSDTYRRVMPLDTPLQAYWQLPVATQPRFLQAALLNTQERWNELSALAADWVRADPDDGEPWYLLGTALGRLGRPAEARDALECSLHLDPARAAARLELAHLQPVPQAPTHPCTRPRS